MMTILEQRAKSWTEKRGCTQNRTSQGKGNNTLFAWWVHNPLLWKKPAPVEMGRAYRFHSLGFSAAQPAKDVFDLLVVVREDNIPNATNSFL